MKDFWRKAEEWALFVFILLIPTQLGKHFWPEWSLVMGVRVDYFSPTLYAVDLVWLVWIVTKLQITNYQLPATAGRRINKVVTFETILLTVLVVLNILVAENREVALYRTVRLIQLAVTYLLLKNEGDRVKKYLMRAIPVWVTVESLLGLAQLSKGSSLEGIWWWLGERRFRVGNIAVAQISVWGQGMLRAYGTFSHPNSLAGFLLVVLVLWRRFKDKINNKIWWWIIAWLTALGVIISGSRTAWAILFLLAMINNYQIKTVTWKRRLGTILIISGSFVLLLGLMGVNYKTWDFVSGWDNDSLAKRVNLNVAALKMWRDNPFLGVGLGNFIQKIPQYQEGNRFYWLQPAHNIFLLWGTETGILGVMGAVWLLKDIWVKKNFRKTWVVWGVVLVTGMADHYWLTLPQNSWLLVLLLAVK